MKKLILLLALLFALTLSTDLDAKTKRSGKQRADFQRAYPCPSTGKAKGACPGYVVDHIIPLKRGAADSQSNMQWQTIREAKEKDKRE